MFLRLLLSIGDEVCARCWLMSRLSSGTGDIDGVSGEKAPAAADGVGERDRLRDCKRASPGIEDETLSGAGSSFEGGDETG